MPAAVAPPDVLSLIADPRRWRLIAELSRSDRRVGELTELLDLPQNLVSYHLGELRRAGVVVGRRSAADRRDVYYRADLHRCRDLLAEAGAGLHPGLRLVPSPPASGRPSGRTPRVLFLCTGNSARSQMAEALLVARSARTIEARSAGSAPKPLHPRAVATMAARRIDIGDASTKHFHRYVRGRFDRVITLCDKVREVCPEFPAAASCVHWSIADPAAADPPAAGDPDPFALVADELERRIELLIAELVAAVPSPSPDPTDHTDHTDQTDRPTTRGSTDDR
ncbi:MAG: helix-turn-helix domain-containing protein [Acidimicrobiales bacterium]|nr:helix-turn-helix domain-containing protein [Acidimicrobiales bacterium]